MAYLNKESLLIKLGPFGVRSVASLNRLIREQHLPAKYISARKVFFDEAEVEVWMSRRYESVVKSNATQVKSAKQQRKLRRESEIEGKSAPAPVTPVSEITPFKAKEA
ncbi:MAG: hypothetical protein LBQ44_10610 [Treponema sp.]|jgi:hypothetical protein|nr:hypothetical protein [Treponema sp.]